MANFPTLLSDPTTPFYVGSASATAGGASETGGVTVCVPNTITLDGYTFPVELKEWRSGPQDTFRDQVVANDQPSDALFNARGAWARYQYSWHHGSGQQLRDLDELADPYRYLSGYGIAWHTKYQATLLPSTQLRQASAATGLVLCRSDAYVFFGAGTTLYRTTDLITWTAMTDPGGTIQALASDGTDLYVATSTKLVKYIGAATTSTAFATPVAGDCSNVAFMSNRLVVAAGNVLSEVAASGVLTTIKTHFQAAFRWTALFNIGSRMYVGGFAGSRSELHTVTTDSAGALVQSQEAAPLPVGEKLRGGISFSGAALLMTNNGVRFAQVSGDGTLTYGPLIEEPGDVLCAVADGRYVFTGWSTLESNKCGVARMIVDDEVAPLQPSYASDVFESAAIGAVSGVARLGGKTAFAVDGSGVWVESTGAYVGQGEIRSGRISFGTVEPKGLIGLTLEFAPLLAGEAFEATVYDENGVNIGVGAMSTPNETQLEIDLKGEMVPFVTVKVTVTGPGTTTPVLYRWRMRAYPVPPPVLQWVLPLIVGQQVTVNAGEGQTVSMDLDAMNTWIEDLWGERRYTLLRVGGRSYRVRVDNFEWRPAKWTDDGELPQGLLVVQLVDA